MDRPEFGLTLTVRIDLLTTAQGGRTHPVRSGYRPICLIPVTDGPDVMVGMCELSLDNPLTPGETGVGRLKFARAVSELVRSLVRVGSRFALAEGNHPIGHAEVREIKP
jgi:translation elongation factor EF-Tu-like GTPase